MRLGAILLSVIIIFGAACAGRGGARVQPRQPDYFEHTVMYPGETLGLIARWYTGSTANWEYILDHNLQLDPRRIRLGDIILIPRDMMTREDPLPRRAVSGGEAPAAAQGAPAPMAGSGAVAQPPSMGSPAEAAPAAPAVEPPAPSPTGAGSAAASGEAPPAGERMKTREELLEELLAE